MVATFHCSYRSCIYPWVSKALYNFGGVWSSSLWVLGSLSAHRTERTHVEPATTSINPLLTVCLVSHINNCYDDHLSLREDSKERVVEGCNIILSEKFKGEKAHFMHLPYCFVLYNITVKKLETISEFMELIALYFIT